jgi:hypothetical protein
MGSGLSHGTAHCNLNERRKAATLDLAVSPALDRLIARRRRSTAAWRREVQSSMRQKNEAFKSVEDVREARAFDVDRQLTCRDRSSVESRERVNAGPSLLAADGVTQE